MGNYYEGELSFNFDRDSSIDEVFNECFPILNAFYSEDVHYLADYKEILDDSKYDNNFIVKGLRLFKNDNYNSYHWARFSLLITESTGISYWIELNEIPNKKIRSLNELIDYLLNDNIFGNDTKIVSVDKYDITFRICEKYYDDKYAQDIISLYSPYISNEYIGYIEDEDWTFKKNYYKFNKKLTNHPKFCGIWCKSYWEEAYCGHEDQCEALVKHIKEMEENRII